jgi:pyruvate/2-oxoglutarate/acetoin dehydrogenase E1 component
VVVGISAGVSYGALGSTHHSLHDLAALRALHNVSILAPADNFETRQAVRAAARAVHPVYLRFGKAPMYDLHGADAKFDAGRAIVLRDGADAAFIATGEAVVHAHLAAGRLAEEGLDCRVLSMHTIRPLDVQAVLAAGRQCRAVITVEEHSIHGGLGEACAAALMQAGLVVPFRIVGLPDEETVTGSQADIFRHYRITMEGLAEAARNLLQRPLVDVRRADIGAPVVQELIAQLNAELSRRYNEPGANHFRLDAEEVADGRGAFFVAYREGEAVGCGAVRRIDATTAEVKRMYVVPAARSAGVARQVLSRLEAEARALGAGRIVLETGIRSPEAVALYQRAGYAEIPLFGEYLGSPLSVCMGKDL